MHTCLSFSTWASVLRSPNSIRKATWEGNCAGSRKFKRLKSSSTLFCSGVPVSNIRCSLKTALFNMLLVSEPRDKPVLLSSIILLIFSLRLIHSTINHLVQLVCRSGKTAVIRASTKHQLHPHKAKPWLMYH